MQFVVILSVSIQHNACIRQANFLSIVYMDGAKNVPKSKTLSLRTHRGVLPGNSIDRAGALKLKAQVTQLSSGADPLLCSD